MELAAQWYTTSFNLYRTYAKTNVKDHLKKKMLKFYTDCPEAWRELLTLKGFTTPAAASSRKSSAGITYQEPIATAVPDFDE